jgi:hypothetical protein
MDDYTTIFANYLSFTDRFGGEEALANGQLRRFDLQLDHIAIGILVEIGRWFQHDTTDQLFYNLNLDCIQWKGLGRSCRQSSVSWLFQAMNSLRQTLPPTRN